MRSSRSSRWLNSFLVHSLDDFRWSLFSWILSTFTVSNNKSFLVVRFLVALVNFEFFSSQNLTIKFSTDQLIWLILAFEENCSEFFNEYFVKYVKLTYCILCTLYVVCAANGQPFATVFYPKSIDYVLYTDVLSYKFRLLFDAVSTGTYRTNPASRTRWVMYGYFALLQSQSAFSIHSKIGTVSVTSFVMNWTITL